MIHIEYLSTIPYTAEIPKNSTVMLYGTRMLTKLRTYVADNNILDVQKMFGIDSDRITIVIHRVDNMEDRKISTEFKNLVQTLMSISNVTVRFINYRILIHKLPVPRDLSNYLTVSYTRDNNITEFIRWYDRVKLLLGNNTSKLLSDLIKYLQGTESSARLNSVNYDEAYFHKFYESLNMCAPSVVTSEISEYPELNLSPVSHRECADSDLIIPYLRLGSCRALTESVDAIITVLEPREFIRKIRDYNDNIREDMLMNIHGTKKYFFPMSDGRDDTFSDYRKIVYQIIHGYRKRAKTVLVHCAAGVSRSASFVVGYIMSAYGVSFDDTLRYVRFCRKCVDPCFWFTHILSADNPQVTIREYGSSAVIRSHERQYSAVLSELYRIA